MTTPFLSNIFQTFLTHMYFMADYRCQVDVVTDLDEDSEYDNYAWHLTLRLNQISASVQDLLQKECTLI